MQLGLQDNGQVYCYGLLNYSDVNKDWTCKDKDKDKDKDQACKDKDKDQTCKDKDKDKDLTHRDQDKDKDFTYSNLLQVAAKPTIAIKQQQ